MMRCPLCGTPAHTRHSTYLEDGSRDTIVQCQNVYCSATFLTNESFYMAVESSVLKPRSKQAAARAKQGCDNG